MPPGRHQLPREFIAQHQRARIIAALADETVEKGYRAVTVADIVRRAGIARNTFYDEFVDKDACYLDALSFGIAKLEAIAAAGADSADGWRGKLRAGISAVLDALEADPAIGRALIVEVHAAGPPALKIRSEAMKRVTDFIDSARHASTGTESPPPIAAEGIVAGMHAVVHAKLAAGDESGFRELLPDFMYFAVLPYFGSEVADAEMKAARA